MKKRVGLLILIVLLMTILFTACSLGDSSDSESATTDSTTSEDADMNDNGDDKVLNIAYDAPPPSMDPHLIPAESTMELTRPIYETLVAFDGNYEPQPELAESWDLSDDQKTITFHLREGVTFHNGQEMTAEDVVASMRRWQQISFGAMKYFANASFEIVDENTVVLNMEKPNALAFNILASTLQSAAIMPKEVIEGAAETGVTEYIGTGPYMVGDYEEDIFIELVKFDDYQALETPSSGLTGKKEALVGTMRFDFVGDPSTRTSGLQTGIYDIAHRLPGDSLKVLKDDPTIEVETLSNTAIHYTSINKVNGIFSSLDARKALQTGMDMNGVMLSIIGDEDLFKLDANLASEDQVLWYNEAGKDLYNQNNIEEAKEFLKRAGYDGEEIVILTSNSYPVFYNQAVNLQQQLEEIGVKSKLDVYDWATMLEKYEDPESGWDLATMAQSTPPDPLQLGFLEDYFPAGPNTDKHNELLESFIDSESKEEMSELFSQLQQEFYENVPSIILGWELGYYANNKSVSGLSELSGAVFWGIEKEE